jgi:hypothetical protein
MSRRSGTLRRHRAPARVFAVGLAVVGLLAAASFASAASLSLNAGSVTTVVSGHPCAGQATATPTSGSGTTYLATSVTVPPGCAGLSLGVTLLQGTAVVRNGTATVASSGATVVTFAGSYTASSTMTIRATVGGWDLPTSWTFTPPVPLPAVSCRVYDHPSATCSVVVTGFTVWGYPSTTHFQLDLQVVGDSNANNQHWELTFNFADAYYPFVPRGVQSNGGLVLQSGCSALPTMTVRGNPGWAGPYDQIRSGQTRAVYLQGYLNVGGNLLACP